MKWWFKPTSDKLNSHCCPLLRETLPPAHVWLSRALLLLSSLLSFSPSHSHLSPHFCCYPHAPTADGRWSGSTALPRLPLTRLAHGAGGLPSRAASRWLKPSLSIIQEPKCPKCPVDYRASEGMVATVAHRWSLQTVYKAPCGQKRARSLDPLSESHIDCFSVSVFLL